MNVLEGNPEHQGRFDLGGFGMRTMAGVWQCTPGKFEYTYPGDEICTLLAGKIHVTEQDGTTHTYTAGDIFYTSKGEQVTWVIEEKGDWPGRRAGWTGSCPADRKRRARAGRCRAAWPSLA